MIVAVPTFAQYLRLRYMPNTRPILDGLAALRPKTLLPMHGSAFVGHSEQAIRDMADMLPETIDRPP